MTRDMAPDWIAAAWRDGVLRGWAMGPGDAHLGTETILQTAPNFGALRACLGDAPLVACGANGPARVVPCAPMPDVVPMRGSEAHVPGLQDIHAGTRTRGEETVIAGLVASMPRWDGIVVIPGNRHVWAHVSAGEVVSFQTFETGRLFGVLATGQPSEPEAFDRAFEDVMARPERLAALLSVAAGDGALWGALIAAELAATRPYWLGQDVIVTDDGDSAEPLILGLTKVGVPVRTASGAAALLGGLGLARDRLE